MLHPEFASSDRETRNLLKRYRQLDAEDRRSVRDFIDFLVTRGKPVVSAAPVEPIAEPRPESESVVAAIKRLSRVYPMLDRERMLGETSALMAGHLLQGRVAADVIDDLESVFARHYKNMNGGENV